MILTAPTFATHSSELIITLAAQHRLPAIYPARRFVVGGGLISYGPVVTDHYRLAASYVDRILKGEKAADLPVQAPTKYELVVNLTSTVGFTPSSANPTHPPRSPVLIGSTPSFCPLAPFDQRPRSQIQNPPLTKSPDRMDS